MSYNEIDKLMKEGDYDKALTLIEQLPPEEVSRGLSAKCGILSVRGQHQDAIQLANEVIHESKEKSDQLAALLALFWKLNSLMLMNEFGDFDESAKEINDLAQLGVSQDNQFETKEWISMLYGLQGMKASWAGNYEKSMEMGKKGLALANEITSPMAKAYSLYAISCPLRDTEKITRAFEYVNKSLDIAQQYNLKPILCLIYHSLDLLYRIKGDLTNSLKYSNLALTLGQEMKMKFVIDFITGNVGHQPAALGNYDQAIELFKEGYRLAQARNDFWVMTQRLNDIGHVYRIKGELSLALSTFEESLALSKKIGNEFFQSKTYQAIGMVYYDQGSYQQALETFQRSLSIVSGVAPKSLSITSTLLALVSLNVELDNINDAKQYLTQLEDINKSEKSDNIKINYQFAKALVLKASPRMKNKAQAQAIFETIAENTKNPHETITFAMYNLCELLLYEFRSESESEILNEIKTLSQRLYNIGVELNVFPTTIKALLLQAKLSLVEGNLNKVEVLLKEAQQIAQEKGLGKLLTMVTQEQEQIKSELDKWNSFIVRNTPIQERIAQAALESYIKSALQIIDVGQDEKPPS
ncbi:MAG: tetratricopeptide repeat protein [Candidatus Hodarchaeota archaeon]